MANYVIDEIWKLKQQQHENAVKKKRKEQKTQWKNSASRLNATATVEETWPSFEGKEEFVR